MWRNKTCQPSPLRDPTCPTLILFQFLMVGVSLSNLTVSLMTTLDRGCGMSCLAASMHTKQHHAAHAAHAVHEAHMPHAPHRAHEEFAGAESSVLRGHGTVTATTTTATWLLKSLPKVPGPHKTKLISAVFVFLLFFFLYSSTLWFQCHLKLDI